MNRIMKWLFGTCIILVFIYFGVEMAITAQIRSELKNQYKDDYVILRLHMGGEDFNTPELWKMLWLIYEYNYTDGYEPQGSGGYTGKKYYLTILVSDNKIIRDFYWSFRNFNLDTDSDKDIPETPWDVIENLPKGTAAMYSFNESDRVRRRGLWFSSKNFQNKAIRFYYRTMAKEK